MRILAIDDAEELTLLIQVVLEDRGWVVHTAADAAEGLLLARQGYDLILLDKNLPDMSEEEALKRLTGLLEGTSARIVHMTGTKGSKPALGTFGLLEKPFDPSTLGERLLKFMESQ